MIFWIITTIITFFYLRWLIKVPCFIPTRSLMSKEHPDFSNYRDKYIYTYSPIGMKIWIFLLLIIVSLVPILNIAGIIVGTVVAFLQRMSEDISLEDLFPKGPGKIMTFLNKPL